MITIRDRFNSGKLPTVLLITRRDQFEIDHSSFETSMVWLLHLNGSTHASDQGIVDDRKGSIVSGLLIFSNCNGMITTFEKFDSGCLTSLYDQSDANYRFVIVL